MAELLNHLEKALGNRYRVERELGHGGMGLVFLAEDLKHHRHVALKVLRPELAQSLGAERFLREIRISAQLNHPNILTLIDSGEVDGFMYYVMPYVEGESLRDRLTKETQLPIEDALRITREVADALSYAHSLGVVHRDIKPENILFEAGHAVVGDFGIARAVSEAGGEQLTESGLAVGTPAYMSPEQASGSDPVDARTDIYSLGCVLYEMLVGEPPYVGPTPQAILARKAVEPVPSLRVVRDTVSVAVERAITKALAKVPADRFATARQFTEALSGEGFAAAVAASAIGVGRKGQRVLAMALVGMLIATGTYALVRHNGGSLPGRPAPLGASVSQLTAEPGVEWFPSLSPDGKWIVYAGDGAGDRDIYLKSVGGQNPINLTGDSPADDDQPAFSRDGERIAFRSSREGGGIFVMGRTGESVRRVTRMGFKPTWSSDGTQLAFVSENVEMNPQNSEGRSQLWVADVNTGETRQLDVIDAVLASWSPHGQRIAYTKRLAGQPSQPAQGDVWTIPAGGGEPTAVTTSVATDWNPEWSPDGRYLYFASDRGGSMNLWRVAIDEGSGRTLGEPEAITTPATSLAHISIAADGQHIAYSSVLVTTNIQKAALDPTTQAVIGEPEWVTTGTRRWSSPDPAPDGKTVAFYSLVRPDGDLYVVGVDGTGLRQLTGGDSTADRVPRWSPDGKWIAFFSNRSGPLQIWKIRRDGSELSQLTEAAGDVGVPVWSPDGSRMAGSQGLTTTSGYVVLLDPNRPWHQQIPDTLPPPDTSLGRFTVNAWSPDGEWLAGDMSFKDAGIVIYSFRSRAYERLTDFGQWPVWLPDSRRVLFVSGGHALFVVDRATKRVRKIFSVARDLIGPPRLSRDGRQMFFSRRVTEADIWLLTLR
jgi:Tol biopolymer transport system component